MVRRRSCFMNLLMKREEKERLKRKSEERTRLREDMKRLEAEIRRTGILHFEHRACSRSFSAVLLAQSRQKRRTISACK